MAADVPFLDAEALKALAAASPDQPCAACASLRAPGWEALSATFDAKQLRKVATLRQPGLEDPTLEEHHPRGTNSWSADAPIAPVFFPYNRCDVWQCVRCGRPFLRYTEYGGYYVEERVRPLQAALVA
ncbi:hypothetical protein [Ramlibacter sp.]|uniref:hypothetical protein n=1 Tax=Ramlibacter sp. TaxID=1917967 RepID=UPI002FC79749